MILGVITGGSVTGGGRHVGTEVGTCVGFLVTGALVGLAVLGSLMGLTGQTGEGVGQLDGLKEEGEKVGTAERKTKGVKVG